MTVIGIIAILMALLVPVASAARRAAQTTQCASNLRNISQAMFSYAAEFKGKFPPNVGGLKTYWYNRDTTGRYIKQAVPGPDNQLINGVFVCPSDLMEPLPAVRSYAMNVWASGAVSEFVAAWQEGPLPKGKLWDSSVAGSSNMILMIESFSAVYCPDEKDLLPKIGFAPPAIVGGVPNLPGERFTGAGGWSSYVADEGRFGTTASHIAYFRHRGRKEPGSLGDAMGRLNIAFADGHVALHSDKDLVKDGRSTFLAMWSPIDREVEANFLAEEGVQ